MKAQFIVTINGKCLHNGKPVTSAIMERELREAAKECFAHLASRVTVKRTTSTTAGDSQPAVGAGGRDE